MHVVKTEGVGLEGADLEGLLPVDAQLGTASIAEIAVIVGLIGIDGGPRGECRWPLDRHGATACGVFPFGLRQQSVGLAGLLAEPGNVLASIFPRYVDDG